MKFGFKTNLWLYAIKKKKEKRMNRITKFLALALVFFIAVSALVFAGGQQEKGEDAKIVVKYSDSDPPGGVRTAFLADYFLPEIEKQTAGQIELQDFWGGALLGPPEALKGIKDGITDIGFLFPEFFPEQLPLHQIFKLFPVGPGSWKAQRWIYENAYAEIPELKAELAKWNQMPLLMTAGLPGTFTSSYKVDSIDDLDGKKWRASSRWLLGYLKSAGAIPVSVPWADCYMALQTGTVDGVLANLDGIHMTKQDEAAGHIFVAKEMWWATPFLHNVNLDFWNSLPEDVQQEILQAAENAKDAYSEAYDNAFDEIIATQEANGIEVEIASPEQIANWQEVSQAEKLQQQWVEEAKEAGYDNAQEIMDKMREIVKQGLEMD